MGRSRAFSGAQAKIWDFSYSDGGYTASGEFITGDTGSPYQITTITGMADSSAITGISGFASADNLLFYPPNDGYYADTGGISFENAVGVDFNISNYPTNNSNYLLVSTLDPGGGGCCQVAIEMTVSSAVPEASTWAMMGLGFAGLGFAGFRARRNATALPV